MQINVNAAANGSLKKNFWNNVHFHTGKAKDRDDPRSLVLLVLQDPAALYSACRIRIPVCRAV